MLPAVTPRKLVFQDGTGTPQVSPTQTSASGVLTLVVPSGAIYCHVKCDAKGLKFGTGTLAGSSDGNGYCNGLAAEWVVIPCGGVASIKIITSDASQQNVEHFWESLG